MVEVSKYRRLTHPSLLLSRPSQYQVREMAVDYLEPLKLGWNYCVLHLRICIQQQDRVLGARNQSGCRWDSESMATAASLAKLNPFPIIIGPRSRWVFSLNPVLSATQPWWGTSLALGPCLRGTYSITQDKPQNPSTHPVLENMFDGIHEVTNMGIWSRQYGAISRILIFQMPVVSRGKVTRL